MIARRSIRTHRSGTVVPIVAVSMVCLCGFMAMAIDVGMIAVAKTECQNAADVSALVGARALDGRTPPGLSNATLRAKEVASGNRVLAGPLSASKVSVTHGAFHYDPINEEFVPQFPPTPPDTYNLTRVTVSHTLDMSFARTLGINISEVTAQATAAHRPRDVSIVLDFSGSMNNESDLWNNEGYLGSANNSPNNADPVFPRFGHYSNLGSARLQTTSSDPRVGKCNITQEVLGIPPIVEDFYQHGRGDSPVGAFTPAPSSYDVQPGGDLPLLVSNHGGTSYATNLTAVNSVSGSILDDDFEDYGYDFYYLRRVLMAEGMTADDAEDEAKEILDEDTMPIPDDRMDQLFKGYTQGPNYWGKTFFMWPPNPVGRHDSLPDQELADWRKRFFLKPGGSYPDFGGPVDDNTALWDNNGAWRDPGNNYVINYRAILAWIRSGPNVFPDQLRAGRILYYSTIPDDVPAAAYNHSRDNDLINDPDQRFWKEYIDFTIGVWRDPYGKIQRPAQPACSYGPDFDWGSRQIRSRPTNGRFMDYGDNPRRPRHRFWFGPMTLTQYVLDVGLLPGTAHDISMYPAKLGIAGALQDIKNNHPNDLVSLILFSRPRFHNEPAGAFNDAQFSLSRDYDGMIEALWFPPNSSTSDVRPWDENGLQTPRAFGDFTSNTATQHGFMLAYNQFSSSSEVRAQAVGGRGRKGTQRLLILESDGMANVNTRPDAGFQNNGPNRSFYRILKQDVYRSGSYNENDLLNVVRRICAPEENVSVGPGYSTPRRPVIIHTIAFGVVFEPTASGSQQSSAVDLLQKISTIGRTTFPNSSSDSTHGYKWCIGTLDERKAKLRQAFSQVMDDGVTVSLVE